MSTKNKLTKFKKDVASSSSSSSSSQKPTSSTTTLTIPQANTLQALHQEQVARIASTTLPNLASSHSRHFLHLARPQTHDSLWTTQKLNVVRFRKSLWAEDIEPELPLAQGTAEAKVVPDFYHKHNGRCAQCALPLIPGLNQLLVRREAKTGKGGIPKKLGRKEKRVYRCTRCHHKTRS